MISVTMNEGYWGFVYSYPFLNTSPYFDNLRDEPRFITILEMQKKKYDEYVSNFGDI